MFSHKAVVMVAFFGLPTLACFSGGCASTPCKFEKADTSVDLTKYKTCYVADAACADGIVVPADVLHRTGDRIASELRGRKTFETVLREPPSDDTPCLHVCTEFRSYRPGSRMLRGLLIGLGTAEAKMQVRLQDGQDRRQLASASVTEFWGWGGIMGMSRGIEDMENSAVLHIGEGIDKACR